MLLTLFGAVATFVAAYFTFKTANENGRKGWLWTLISLFVGFGLQIFAPFVLAVVLAIFFIITGTPQHEVPSRIDSLATVLFYTCWALSFVGLFLVIKFVAKIPEYDERELEMLQPPPPPNFS